MFDNLTQNITVELAVVFGKRCKDVKKANAFEYVSGYAVAIDATCRSLQEVAKKASLPWTAAKGFDTSCPISDLIEVSRIGNPQDVRLQLELNGEMKQNGTTADMIFDIATLIEHASAMMTLEAGDILLTGTPNGVGPFVGGDHIRVRAVDVLQADFDVVYKD